MDATDHQLLSLLRTDARTHVAALAKKLGVSRGTVSNRIAKMEDAGIIVGYTVRLRPDAQPNQIKAWMSVAVQGNATRQVIASLLGEPGVAALHDTNGRWDLLAELRADMLKSFQRRKSEWRYSAMPRSTVSRPLLRMIEPTSRALRNWVGRYLMWCMARTPGCCVHIVSNRSGNVKRQL